MTLYPRGALREEALALEATSADPARARDYARRYLAAFPGGAHAARARTLIGDD